MTEQIEKKNPTFQCCICKRVNVGYGNDPHPYMYQGRCCDTCNLLYVIPLRYSLSTQKKNP